MSPWRSYRFLHEALPGYAAKLDPGDPVWQPRFHDFNLFTPAKIEEKRAYMHLNPVRAGLLEHASDWPWSSARFYEQGLSVGVPVGWVT